MKNHFIIIGTILGLGLIGVVVILLTIPSKAAPGATTPTPNTGENLHGNSIDGQIIFSRDGFLWSWRGDSAKRLPLEPGASSVAGNNVQLIQPAISADGGKLAYIRQDETFSDLWVANSDGTNPRNLTSYKGDGTPRSPDFIGSSLWAFNPTWSPDGTQIAFLSDIGTDDLALWSTDAKQYQRTALSKFAVGNGGLLRPGYMPNGNSLVVGAFQNGKSQIYSIGASEDAGTPTQLTNVADGAYDSAVSPDGQYIAYISRKGNSSELWVMHADGTGQTLLSNQPSRSPAWSPDGKSLAYLSMKDGSFELFVMKLKADSTPDGSSQQLSQGAKLDGADGLSWGR